MEAQRFSPVGDGNSAVSRPCNTGTDSRHHLKRHSMGSQKHSFFPAPAEYIHISAFQTDSFLIFHAFLYQKPVNLPLFHGVVAAGFSHINLFTAGFRFFQQFRSGQPVIDYTVGFPDFLQAFYRNQSRIPRTGSHQNHCSCKLAAYFSGCLTGQFLRFPAGYGRVSLPASAFIPKHGP